MADNNNQQRTSTSTQIRNLYSDGMCYLNVSFFNTSLSLKFYPFLSKDNVGRSKYDTNNGQTTTVNYEAAYALYQMSKDIIDGKIQEANLIIPCAGGQLSFERKMGQGGMETLLSISKNNVVIPFRFQTISQQVKENGQQITKTIEVGLGAFMKTIEGYLTGINADRHLDKLTEEYAKLQEGRNCGQGFQNGGFRQQGGGYPKRQYNGQGGGYKKPYNNQNRGQQGGWQGGPPNQQNMSGYNLPN